MSPTPRDAPASAAKRTVGVEVHVYKAGKPHKRVQVKSSPATIGRAAEADIRLDSGHVSRAHADLHFDDRGMKLIDKDSRNGFSVRGAKAKRATISADDTVSICDFQLRFRPLVRRVETLEAELSAGWADLEDDEDPDTGVHEIPLPPPESHAGDPTLAQGDRSAASAAPEPSVVAELGEDLDPEELEEYLRPDLPPLLDTLHGEANALLYNDPHANVGVEVIQTVGGQVFDVDLLGVGESCWWGGTPRGLAAMVVVPTVQHFPMVTHTRHGEYRVQIPDGGRWKLFHRGDRQVDVHRSGPLVGCLAELQDQIEINYGAFAVYVRCVRAPPRVGSALRWRSLAPDRLLLTAMLVSLGLHTGAMAVPIGELPPLSFRLPYSDDYVVVDVSPAPDSVASPPPPPAPRKPAPAPEPLRESSMPSSPQPAPRPRRARPAQPAQPADPPPAAPGPSQARAVSVSDFRISGMIAHLPTVEIDRPGPSVRGGARLLRGGGRTAAGPGIFSKHPSQMRLTPKGRLAPEVVRKVVNQHAREIERCYNASLARERGLEGRVELEWVVGRVGTVAHTRIIYDEVGSDALERCLRTSIQRWVFPPPRGGTARVSFPFVFSNLRR